MGGYGSGGHNKKKGIVENYGRIDSFAGDQAPEYIKLETVPSGISISKYYLCPICGKRARYLYDIKDHYYFVCRECLGVNYSSQSLPADEKAAIGAKRALESIGIDTSGMTPWDIMHYPLEDIGRKGTKKYDDAITKYYKCKEAWYECMAAARE